MQSENIAEIAKALAAAQSEIKDPSKTRTGKVSGTTKAGKYYEYEYKYADLADVLKNVREALSKHQIAISQPTVLHDNVLIVQTKLMHSSGEWLTSDYPVCSISGEHQKMGAALTYAKRYALTSMVGVAADDDTDGEGASAVDAPRNGAKATRGPQWGASSQAKKRGDWSELEADLRDCTSAIMVDKLQREYEATLYPIWSAAWREQAEELFEKRREDFGVDGDLPPIEERRRPKAPTLREQLQDSLTSAIKEQGEPATRSDYLSYCNATIDVLNSVDEVNGWWEEQTAARKRFRLSPAEESDIKARAKERLKTIRKPVPTTTFVPNARERAENSGGK